MSAEGVWQRTLHSDPRPHRVNEQRTAVTRSDLLTPWVLWWGKLVETLQVAMAGSQVTLQRASESRCVKERWGGRVWTSAGLGGCDLNGRKDGAGFLRQRSQVARLGELGPRHTDSSAVSGRPVDA